jgi:hypothetical protein
MGPFGRRRGVRATKYFHIVSLVSHSQNYSEARLLFEAGKDRDGYFANEHLLKQTDKAINIFEAKTNRTMTALFLYDNAPGHLK